MKRPLERFSRGYKRETIEWMRGRSWCGLDGVTILDLVPLSEREWHITFFYIAGCSKTQIRGHFTDKNGKEVRRQEVEETLARARSKVKAYRKAPDTYTYNDMWLRHEAVETHDRQGRLLFDDQEQAFLSMAAERMVPEEIRKRLGLSQEALDTLVERVREKHAEAWEYYLERQQEWKAFTGHGTYPAMVTEVIRSETESPGTIFDPEMPDNTKSIYRKRGTRQEKRSPAELDRMQAQDAHAEENRVAELYDMAVARILEDKKVLDEQDRQALEEIAKKYLGSR